MENPTQDSPQPDTLTALAETAKAHRLSPADEEKVTALLCEQLKGGRAGITAVIEPLLAFPWIVSVNAIAAVWSELSQPMQRHLISGLAKVETEQARRLRLSVARAVFKLDPAAGVRLAIAAAADFRNPETGTLSTRSRQIFFHVFIGKGKPWLCMLPLEGAKGADALIHAALEAMPLSPPLSQLSILRWIHGAGRFKRLTAEQLALVAKAVGRWNYRLQQGLKADIPELPEAIVAVLKPERIDRPEADAEGNAAGKAPHRERKRDASPDEADQVAKEESASGEGESATEDSEPTLPVAGGVSEEEAGERSEEKLEQVDGDEATESQTEGGERPPRLSREERQAARRRERDARREEQREQRRRERNERDERGGRSERGEREKDAEVERPVRRAFDPAKFDLRDTLRGVESYVASLRQEIEQAKAQLRRKDDDSLSIRRARRGRDEAPDVDTEELTRHNARLESTIAELRQQLEDLTNHHEAVAESRELHGDVPLPEGSADQLRTLLNIKLHESYETFLAMKEDPLDRVFRLDYRDLLGSVFEVLLKEGVSLKKP